MAGPKQEEAQASGSRVVETPTCHIRLGDDGVLRVVNRPNSVHELDDAKANMAACTELLGNRRVPLLVDGTGATSMSRAARQYYAGEEAARVVRAQALILKSPVSKVIGNFFLGLNRAPFPTKLFTSENEALEWLRGFRDE